MSYATRLATRYRDLDPRGHVNHAVHATLLEQAKVDFFEEAVGVDLSTAPTVVRALKIEYERPVGLEPVRAELDVAAVGGTSYTIEYELYAGGERAATATTTEVVLDPETRDPTPVPEAWREELAAWSAEG